jgi:hypothetical protein
MGQNKVLCYALSRKNKNMIPNWIKIFIPAMLIAGLFRVILIHFVPLVFHEF